MTTLERVYNTHKMSLSVVAVVAVDRTELLTAAVTGQMSGQCGGGRQQTLG